MLTLLLSFVTYSLVQCALTTRSQPPFIASISPSLTGSAEGGTELTINGANFAQEGLFSSRAVFIGGQLCKIIDYYSNNDKIVCITPKCVTPTCLSDQDWQGYEDVSLSIYVSTVEGILEGFSTYRYNGGYTPSIYKMQHNTWATSISQIVGKYIVNKLDMISIKIGEQYADLGLGNEINEENIYMWDRSKVLYYRPPTDMTAGFYNFSLTTQSNEISQGYYSNGIARMYPKQASFLYENNYLYDHNYDVSLSGIKHSITLYPVITSIYPHSGSIIGGTKVTITGHGFSNMKENIFIYIAGRVCDVTGIGSTGGSELTEIIHCITRNIYDISSNTTDTSGSSINNIELYSNFLYTTTNNNTNHNYNNTINTYKFINNTTISSNRNYGSAGWWMKLWDSGKYQQNQLTDSTIAISNRLSQALSLSLTDLFSTSWPLYMNYNSQYSDSRRFAADFSCYFIAPYTGILLLLLLLLFFYIYIYIEYI